MAEGRDWANDPTVAGWLATDAATPATSENGHVDDGYRVADVDEPIAADAVRPRSAVRGGVGIDDPTEQFPAAVGDPDREVDAATLLPTHHNPGVRSGGHPVAEQTLGLSVPSAVPARSRGGNAATWAKRYKWPLALVAAAVVTVVGTIAVQGAVGGDTAPKADGPGIAIPSAQDSAAPVAGANADCPTGTQGPVTTGRDAGGTDSGPGVIKAFEFAYYVDRSGEKARSMVTPAAKFSTAAQLQASIDKFIDPQTLHCVAITDRTAGLYAVELTETPPRGQAPVVYHQLVQTTTAGNRTWIVSISADKDAP